MRISTPLAMLSAFALVFLSGEGSAQAQGSSVQQAQTPQQSEQSRDQDQSRAEGVRIGRDWRIHGGESAHDNQATAPDEDHRTVGRDWRMHEKNGDRQ